MEKSKDAVEKAVVISDITKEQTQSINTTSEKFTGIANACDKLARLSEQMHVILEKFI